MLSVPQHLTLPGLTSSPPILYFGQCSTIPLLLSINFSIPFLSITSVTSLVSNFDTHLWFHYLLSASDSPVHFSSKCQHHILKISNLDIPSTQTQHVKVSMSSSSHLSLLMFYLRAWFFALTLPCTSSPRSTKSTNLFFHIFLLHHLSLQAYCPEPTCKIYICTTWRVC